MSDITESVPAPAYEVNIKILSTGEYYNQGDILYTLPYYKICTSIKDITDATSYNFFNFFDREILWDFGDGTVVRGKDAEHLYTKPGIYTINYTLFDKDGNPYQNTKINMNARIIVKDYLDTLIFFAEDSGSNLETYAGKPIEVDRIICTNNTTLDDPLPVICYANNSSSPDISELDSKDQFIHLNKFHAFIDEVGNYSTKISPNYVDAYITISGNEHTIYIVGDDFGDYINELIRVKCFYEPDKVTIKYISESDPVLSLPDIYHIGKLSISSILYVDDEPSSEVDVSFMFDETKLPEKLQPLSKNNVNLVAIAKKIKILQNTSDNLYIFFSTNGLSSKVENGKTILVNTDGSRLSLAENVYNVEHTMKFTNCTFPLTVRLFKIEEVDGVYSGYFIKDYSVAQSVTDDTLRIEIFDDNPNLGNYHVLSESMYYPGAVIAIYTPLKEQANIQTNIWLKIVRNDGAEILVKQFGDKVLLGDFVAFSSLADPESKYYLDPVQNFIPVDVNETWTAYKTHPAVQEKPVLDQYMLGILGNGFIENAVNKGFNFVDDIVNIETCQIKNLMSIFDSLNMDISIYNNENFSRPLAFNDLMKIISIKHSILTGTKVRDADEFETWDKMAGINRGKEIKPDEIWNEIKVQRGSDGKFIWPVLICYDKFAARYFIVRSEQLKIASDMPLKAYMKDGSVIENYDAEIISDNVDYLTFRLADYYYTWGWGLLLGDYTSKNIEVLRPYKGSQYDIMELKIRPDQIQRAGDIINKFYRFYYYNNKIKYNIYDSYLYPECLSDNIVNYDKWEGRPEINEQGSVDVLLHKTLLSTLDFIADK